MNKRCKTAIGHTLHVLALSEMARSTMRLGELAAKANLEEAIALFEVIEARGMGIVKDSARDTLKVLRWELDERSRFRDLQRNAVMLAQRKVGDKVWIYEGATRVGEGVVIAKTPKEIRVDHRGLPLSMPMFDFDRFGRGISDFRLSIKIC